MLGFLNDLSEDKNFKVMKNFMLFLLLIIGFTSCQEEQKPILNNSISIQEETSLLYMREEEKLAHDVYLHAFRTYGILAFQNIANSESQHVNAVLNLMEIYQINDPLDGSQITGEFTIPEIKTLYQQLIEKVNLSQEDALLVGMLIEDLDIYDLENALLETDNAAIQRVYQSLQCGSMNHLRAFENLVSLSNISYAPVYISQSEYDNIINSSQLSCNN